MTPEELHITIENCKQNSREAQYLLYKHFYAEMVKVCKRYVDGDDQKVVSIINDAFLKVFKNLDKYDDSLGSFSAWVKTIVINTALSAIAVKKRQIDYVYADELPEIGEAHKIYSKFDIQELLEYIRDLPNVTRTVFNMFVMDGCTHKEISQHLNITESTSRWHLSDARKKIQQKIKS